MEGGGAIDCQNDPGRGARGGGRQTELEMRWAFEIKAGVGVANGVRRALISSTKSWAPSCMTVKRNTSSYTDEYLAHRLGLVPFQKVGEGEDMALKERGKKMVHASSLVGHAFEAAHAESLPLLFLEEGQELDVVVHFEEGNGRKHARFCPCAAVGMYKVGAGKYRIEFELLHPGRDPHELAVQALKNMEEEVDEALLQLAKQPQTPPEGYC